MSESGTKPAVIGAVGAIVAAVIGGCILRCGGNGADPVSPQELEACRIDTLEITSPKNGEKIGGAWATVKGNVNISCMGKDGNRYKPKNIKAIMKDRIKLVAYSTSEPVWYPSPGKFNLMEDGSFSKWKINLGSAASPELDGMEFKILVLAVKADNYPTNFTQYVRDLPDYLADSQVTIER